MPMPVIESTDAAKVGTSKAVPPAAALMAELIESSRNLPNSSSSLGSIRLGLSEIRKRAYQLRQKLPVENKTKAHYLLSASHVNAENIESELKSIKFHQHQEPATISAFDIGIENYLLARKEENILASIQESINSTAIDFDNYLAKNITLDWNTRKEQICQYFGLLPSKGQSLESDATKTKHIESVEIIPGWNKNSIGRAVLGSFSGSAKFSDVDVLQPSSSNQLITPFTGGSGSHLSTIQVKTKKFSEAIADLNSTRLNNESYPISHKFLSVFQSLGNNDTRSQQIQDIWKIFIEITGEAILSPVPERKYAKAYLVSSPNSKESIELRKRIVAGSKKFLEKQFMSQLEQIIAKNPSGAQLGGIPSVQSKIRAYLNVRFAQNGRWMHPSLEIVNNVPIWAMIYYMIRSGNLSDAVTFTTTHSEEFIKLGSKFPTYLKAWAESPNQVLMQNILDSMRREFNDQVRYFYNETYDPYKYALYKIVGRCELSNKSFQGVITTTEDWLWVHMSLIYEESTELNVYYEKYTLQDLRNSVTNYGAKYFNPDNKTPLLYCQVLFMCGLFEKAIHYTYSFSQIEAVHFAIALTYYGLLRPIVDVLKYQDELMYVSRKDEPELNFARLVGLYTKDFRNPNPVEAIEYLVLICLNGDLPAPDGPEHLKICYEALKELVLETKEFSKLLGDVRPDGSRKPGAIEERMQLIHLDDLDDYLRAITEQAAVKAEEDGRVSDAVLLYQLSEEYDTVISIINKSLGEMLAVQPLGQPILASDDNSTPLVLTSENPAKLAYNFMQLYTNNEVISDRVKPRNRETCATLLRIVEARDLFAQGDYQRCLQYVNNTNIIVLDANADISLVRRRAQEFAMLHEAVARNVPSMLVMVMECCATLVASVRESLYTNDGRESMIMEMRGIAKNCMVYAGMIQYRMPREVFIRLSTLETEI